MTVSHKDLISFAETLAKGTTEVEYRSAVSRAYYAAYHETVVWAASLPTVGVSKPGSGMHKAHIDALTSPTVTGATALRSRSLGYMLNALKARRTKADYHLTETVDIHEAANAVAEAETIMTKAV